MEMKQDECVFPFSFGLEEWISSVRSEPVSPEIASEFYQPMSLNLSKGKYFLVSS